MAKEYIERETLIKRLSEEIEEHEEPNETSAPITYGSMLGLEGAQAIVSAIPAADVVEVVRCKDCKNLVIINKEPIYAYCYQTRKVFELFGSTSDDTREFFCWHGERKERG